MEGPTVGECLVEEWLRSLNLTHYTQAFLDNGYDELEICKQIGEPDLDAIGVTKPSHRHDIIQAVDVLRNQGSTHVYFVLENLENEEPVGLYSDNNRIFNGEVENEEKDVISDEYAEGKKAFKTYPKLHLSAIVRDKLIKHQVKLADAPFTNQDGFLNTSKLEELAEKYASDLKTHPKDVLEILFEHLKLCTTQQDKEADIDQHVSEYSLYSICGQTLRSVPPPLPTCPPPSHTSRHASFSDQSSSRHSSPSKSRSHSSESAVFRNMESLEEISILDSHLESDTSRKPTDTIGRLFKAIAVKGKTPKKYSYKKVEGDLNASEITMGEEERINLMILVKEGKITTEEALHLLKRYETDRRHEHQQLESSSSTEACMHVVHSPTSHRRTSKFSPFLLFKFGSQRKKKNSLSQGESSASSLTSSPELSSKQLIKHYEGTGTQLYSPIQGVRKKVAAVEAKPKSTGFFGSPKGSPSRSSKKDKILVETNNIDSPKEKKKSSFSSPFSRRKKGTIPSKASNDSPKASLSSLLDDGGVFDSPSSSRRGSSSSLSEYKSRIPGLSRTMSQDCSPVCSPLSIQQETVAIVHYSPKRRVSEKCDNKGIEASAKESDRLVSFKPFSQTTTTERKTPHALSDSRVNAISSESVKPSPKLKQSISSDNYEYAHHIESYLENSSSQENKKDIVESDFICSECGAKHPKRTSHPLGYCIYAIKDAMSPKRRNSPSGTPPDSQSPKRQHISHSPDNTFNKHRSAAQKHNHSSPEHVTEMSPTGTLDSGSMKEGHYGSSSTMSVGSETSPSCTIERTTLKPVTKKLVKRTLDKQAPGIRIRSNSFSTGDEYLSSDQEDTLHKTSEKSFNRSQGKRHSMVDKSLVVPSRGEEHQSDHSVEMPSDPERKLSSSIVNNKEASSSSESKSSVSVEEDTTSHRPTRTKSHRPHTVDGLLTRLGLQHLVPIFVKHGYTTLRSLSDIEEGHLNQLEVQNAEERAKLLTAAQMISDYEDHITSESGQSSLCNSPCHLTMPRNVPDSSPSPQRSLHPSNLTIASDNHSDDSSQTSPVSKRNSEISEPGMTNDRPLYENIDNFENAIPVNELVLCNRGCQSDFDLAAIEGLQSTSGCSQEEVVADLNGLSRGVDSVPSPTGATLMYKSRPQVPERTVSLQSQNDKTKSTVKKCKDASTQHGGILQMMKKRSSTGSLVKTSPSGVAKIKTAEVRHLTSPHNSSKLKGSQTCAKHSSIPRLCAQHKKVKQTSDSVVNTVSKKLHKEAIDLTNRPYTQMDGSCGIPVLLVQRYAEELQADLYEVASAFEAVRTKALQGIARDSIINTGLGDQCLSPTEEPRLSSVQDFLISIGLPMYSPIIVSSNVHTVEQLVNNIQTEDLVRMGITDPAHIRRLRHWMKKLKNCSGSKHSIGTSAGLQDKV